jgi:hypothetical protein
MRFTTETDAPSACRTSPSPAAVLTWPDADSGDSRAFLTGCGRSELTVPSAEEERDVSMPAECRLPRGGGERRLQAPLLRHLESCGWVRWDTLIVHELPWHGRHVDMVTRTRSGSITSYEFKLGAFGRVLEQAIYNRLSFDRSYAVVASMPRHQNFHLSQRYSVGIIVVDQFQARCVLRSPVRHAEPALRARLDARLLAAGGRDV